MRKCKLQDSDFQVTIVRGFLCNPVRVYPPPAFLVCRGGFQILDPLTIRRSTIARQSNLVTVLCSLSLLFKMGAEIGAVLRIGTVRLQACYKGKILGTLPLDRAMILNFFSSVAIPSQLHVTIRCADLLTKWLNSRDATSRNTYNLLRPVGRDSTTACTLGFGVVSGVHNFATKK